MRACVRVCMCVCVRVCVRARACACACVCVRQDMIFPTLDFPSDHAVIAAVLSPACRAAPAAWPCDRPGLANATEPIRV